MHGTPARYLIVIDSSDVMTARLFDAALRDKALAGHNAAERRGAEVFTLDI